jgi:hypothetical protein
MIDKWLFIALFVILVAVLAGFVAGRSRRHRRH